MLQCQSLHYCPTTYSCIDFALTYAGQGWKGTCAYSRDQQPVARFVLATRVRKKRHVVHFQIWTTEGSQ